MKVTQPVALNQASSQLSRRFLFFFLSTFSSSIYFCLQQIEMQSRNFSFCPAGGVATSQTSGLFLVLWRWSADLS